MTKYTDKQGNVWNKESIQKLLDYNDKAALRALKVVYDNQTASEQEWETTRDNNGIGFTGVDAKIMTSIHKWHVNKGYVSPKQMKVIRRKIRKYWRQVLVVIAEKDGHVA